MDTQNRINVVFSGLLAISLVLTIGVGLLVDQQSKELNALQSYTISLKTDIQQIRQDLIRTQLNLEKLQGKTFYDHLFITKYKGEIVVVSQDKQTKGTIVYNVSNSVQAFNWAWEHIAPNGKIQTNFDVIVPEYLYSMPKWGANIEFDQEPPIIIDEAIDNKKPKSPINIRSDPFNPSKDMVEIRGTNDETVFTRRYWMVSSMAVHDSTLVLDNCHYVIIEYLVISNQNEYGIKIVNCTNIILLNNYISTPEIGIAVFNSSDIRLGTPATIGDDGEYYPTSIIKYTGKHGIYIPNSEPVYVQGFNVTKVEGS